MSEVSKSLIVSFDALNLVKGIKSIGGPDKQVFYIESNLFAPDRRITPLILQPYILVEDPHNIIPSGDKVSELSSAEWYFDEIKSENRITAKEENASIDTPFALGANNSLHIRKNVEKAIQLFFEAEYLDTRKNKNIHISLTYLLSTTSSSEVKPAPKLKLSKPQSWKYCPLDKVTEATIEAEVFADNKGYKSAVEWCKVEGDKVIPLANEAFVLGGQNTDKLIVNPHVMGDSLIRARNVSEEFYNKAYGINPEWDNRMQEVFDNRNLILKPYWELGGINGDGTSQPDISRTRTAFIKVKPNTVYTLNLYEDNKQGFGANFYKNDTDKSIAEPQKWEWSQEYITFTTSKETNYLRVNKLNDKLLSLFKLVEGDKSTPYTPAPEDLNFSNLVRNGNFSQGHDWWLYNYQQNPSTKDGWLTTEAKKLSSASRIDCYIPPTNDLMYISFWAKANFESNIYATINPEANTVKVPLNGDKPTFSSNIVNGEGLDRAYFYVPTPNAKIGDKIHYSKCTLINLTTTFGKGNEPTKEQLDAVFADMPYIPAPEDLAPDGIILGSYQSDIKFTKYFPEINAEILFLTGDSIRPEHKTIKAQAIFTTNKEPIKNPSEFFDIEWYLDPVEAGGAVKKIGTGEFMEIPVSDLQLKGGRLVQIRLKYNFK